MDRRPALFKPRILRRHLDAQAIPAERLEAFRAYQARADAIRRLKEEAYQDGFLRDLFVAALGHTLQPDEGYTLAREYKNPHDAKRADAAILLNGEVVGIVELKDTTTRDFDRPRTRGGKSPVEQLFGYLASHPHARYGVLSNFARLRFYLDKNIDYLEFDLFGMGEEEFALLHLLLSRESLEEGLPLRLREESDAAERQITRELYEDYSAFRRHLFDDIRRRNPQIEPARALRLTQKLVDRIVFILFAEDTGLLRKNTIREIREEFHRQKFTDFSLYAIYRFYFRAIAEGDERLDIPRYDGGLFAADPELDGLAIGDEALDLQAQKLSDYDFASDVTVDILGHIFEHSLTDLEEINAALRGEAYDAEAGRRKKEGVFYTPAWVTRYMIGTTLGRLCADRREALGIGVQIDPPANLRRLTAAERETLESLQRYREWLKELRIVDPACGSGAFLNQALRFLVAEHERVREEIARFGDLTAYEEIEREILERNLYGVDINEEACEIARLSLWLSTARPGRPLTRLSGRIRSGDSLVEDPRVSERAFDWEEAFPEVFDRGGFDVVVGNPPYVRQERLAPELKRYFARRYATYHGTADLYVFFVERGIGLLGAEGRFAYIFPNKWMRASYGKPLRRFLAGQPLAEVVDFGDLPVFEEATTYPLILTVDRSREEETFTACEVESLEFADLSDYVARHGYAVDRTALSEEGWSLAPVAVQRLMARLARSGIPLGEYVEGEIYYGIKTGLNDAFVIDEETRRRLLAEDPRSAETLRPFLAGRDIRRYESPEAEKWLIFFPKGWTRESSGLEKEPEAWAWLAERYPAVTRWLEPFASKGRKRYDKGEFWWELRACDYYEKFEEPKILYQEIATFSSFTYDENGIYINNKIFMMPGASKALLALLNSKLVWFFLSNTVSKLQGDAYAMQTPYIEQIPVLLNETLESLAREILDQTGRLQQHRKAFADYCLHALGVEKLSKKLRAPERLDLDALLAELKKKRVPTAELEVFEAVRSLHARLRESREAVEALDRRIDREVYALYGLDDGEIALIEGGE